MPFFWLKMRYMGVLAPKAPRVRYAPSPTGHWHIGGVRTALFNWLFARQNQGVFIMRIEDTDKERSRPEFEAEIFEDWEWLGLDYDEGPVPGKKDKGSHGPYRQSERTALYREYLQKLLDVGWAYYCYCSKEDLEAERQTMTAEGLPPKYGGHCRNLSAPPSGRTPQAIRFKMPEARVSWKDMVRGEISFDAALFGDIVIARDLNSALYNFAAVVDDAAMEITHVIRGEDHISNTPKQILIYKALNLEPPQFGHFPLILSADRSKLSKRFAETSVLNYRAEGYLPEALINFLALLGWHPQDDEEILSVSDLINKFNIKRVQKAGAIWNQEKLDWLNSRYLKALPVPELAKKLEPWAKKRGIKIEDEKLYKIIEIERERIKNLSEFFEVAGFFFELPDYPPKMLIWRGDDAPKTLVILEKELEILKNLEVSDYGRDNLLVVMAGLTEEYGKGSVLWPLRVAVSGNEASPDPFSIIEILSKDETLQRLKLAIEKLGSEK